MIKSPKTWQSRSRPIGQKPRRTWLERIAVVINFFVWLIVFLVLSGIVAGMVVVAYFSKDLPDPNRLIDRQVVESTKIYDRTGKYLLYEIHDDVKRTIIPLDQIPDYSKNAIIALEDKNFYIHHGLAYKRIVLAIYKKLFSGDGGPGASTLTQQLVKNAILTPERTIGRKIKEWVLTLEIERKFDKDQILQLYLNEIPFGSTAYGIEAASLSFFGKSAKELSLAESAVLAAIIKKPTYYSPFGNNRDQLIVRQKLVLDLMAQQGYITTDEADAAKAEKIEFKSRRESIEAPHFVFYVRESLTNAYGEKVVEQGGLKVITSLDYDLQKLAEKAVKEGAEKNQKYLANNAALVSIDPKTGEILAMVGSKDYFDEKNDGEVNVALSLRQPGSSFKPIVYAAAFAKGYTPETILYDVVTTFKTDTKDYTPHNYNNKEQGPISIRRAFAGSLNIPAVKTLYLTGIDRVLNLAEDLGYTSFGDRSRFGLSLVLGGGEVRLLEHAFTFTAFANEGVKNDKPVAILKVEDKNGFVLDEVKYQERRVLSREVAQLVNSVMTDNEARSYIFGFNSPLVLKDRPVAAKTGTTNDFRDAWTIGFTPQLVTGVWVGNNDNSKMKLGSDGVFVAAPIWNQFMTEALKGKEVLTFNQPPANRSQKPVLKGENVGEKIVKIDRASGKLATDFTPLSYIEEKIFSEHHEILHYLSKDDPDGQAPTDPSRDPQYQNWEEAILRWTKEQSQKNPNGLQAPPTEYDNLHVPENRPSVLILWPGGNQLIETNSIDVSLSVSAPRGVRRVEYYLDDQLISTINSIPFNLVGWPASSLTNGFHELKVKVFDDIDNVAEARININVLIPNR